MTHNEELIRHALKYENLSSSAIAKMTGVSQPTVSRTLKKMPVIKLGGGRGTLFALVETNAPKSLYEINKAGLVSQLGYLYRQPEGRMLLVQGTEYLAYEGVPFYFYDAVPSGFLGSIHLKNIVERDARLTTKSQDWSGLQVLHYMENYGDDLAGNLVLGSRMAEQASAKKYLNKGRADYATIAGSINKIPENMGSSIAGEQPKFTLYNGKDHLIVKYSPLLSESNPVATRHRDLMVCEHLALETLRSNGMDGSETDLHLSDRVYLEVKRFDRIGLHGRRGVASLKYIDAEYSGLNGTWPEIAQDLFRQDVISEKDVYDIEVAYAFGKYIANSDMHNGNFSFFMEDLTLSGATPIYDMLPMAFMPVQGELRNPELMAPKFIDVSNEARTNALSMAIQFWARVAEHDLISQDFKKTITPFFESLVELSNLE
ncbi:HipA domain-containing protein [Hydrogenovibrio sp. 3SP14C1]|uniref:HipA domain-containing protein n=1 Tax=Hydrogenovibrio sp. 3SP14C1 TaxID=3038774 RepID=UPI0024174059|nr:HipA domain-containing protein [Hydrogenovibrio sp. 3SP14C1]MDG4811449.1 HipA domain-containing protein [Hydrogenovibrio sp. 3SP14C1]